MKTLIAPSGATIIFGENARENDILTFTHSNKNDLWFHVNDYAGSHVILVNSTNKDDIIFAGKIAIMNSKAKGKKNITVSYCEVICVNKPKNAKNGLVILDTDYVRYIIL